MCVATLIIFKNRGAVIYQYAKSKKIIFPYEILKWKTKTKNTNTVGTIQLKDDNSYKM